MLTETERPTISIILPTYNESQNILDVLKSIKNYIPADLKTEAIVVDDNSPDGTGKLVEDYIDNFKKFTNYTVNVIHRKTKDGLGSALIHGIQKAKGDTIIVMDTDYSHPPHILPKLINTIRYSKCDLAVGSRYIKGGKIIGWPFKRKLMSKIATLLAQKGLDIKIKDPMSGFFAFRKNIIKEIKFDGLGYKLLLEFLVKIKDIRIQEVPYTFENRKLGSSKLNLKTIFDYLKSTWKLYLYGKTLEKSEKRNSIKFLSKAGRFYTVGAFGFLVNYLVSFIFTTEFLDFWYIHATTIGILVSMSSNFILNKIWTFGDLLFSFKRTIRQYGTFIGFSSIGALIQLSIVFFLVDNYAFSYYYALGLGVVTGALGNFLLNKKWTFKEKLFG